MTSELELRWGIWFAPNSRLCDTTAPLSWKMTPRSKQWQCMASSMTLPEPLTLVSSTSTSATFYMSDDAYSLVSKWATPPDAFPPARDHKGCVTLHGLPVQLDQDMKHTTAPLVPGDAYWVRVHASCNKLCGDMYKATLRISGILQPLPVMGCSVSKMKSRVTPQQVSTPLAMSVDSDNPMHAEESNAEPEQEPEVAEEDQGELMTTSI